MDGRAPGFGARINCSIHRQRCFIFSVRKARSAAASGFFRTAPIAPERRLFKDVRQIRSIGFLGRQTQHERRHV
ncbi:MAG: hypothetical protein C4334_10950 [Pyrinomonas sp.]